MCWSATGRSTWTTLFLLWNNGISQQYQALNPIYNKWYMDDGGIIGDVELLKKVWELLQTRGPELGLHPNVSGHGLIQNAKMLAQSN